jgi:hypothetical protein
MAGWLDSFAEKSTGDDEPVGLLGKFPWEPRLGPGLLEGNRIADLAVPSYLSGWLPEELRQRAVELHALNSVLPKAIRSAGLGHGQSYAPVSDVSGLPMLGPTAAAPISDPTGFLTDPFTPAAARMSCADAHSACLKAGRNPHTCMNAFLACGRGSDTIFGPGIWGDPKL